MVWLWRLLVIIKSLYILHILIDLKELRQKFQRREFSFTLQDDIYLRYQSYDDLNKFKEDLVKKLPIKIDIGGVYTQIVNEYIFEAKNFIYIWVELKNKSPGIRKIGCMEQLRKWKNESSFSTLIWPITTMSDSAVVRRTFAKSAGLWWSLPFRLLTRP